MADKPISEFDEATSLASTDILPAVTDPDTTPEDVKITLANLAESIGNLLFPVGSYYINETDSTNPATLLGFGTWSAVTDKFLVGRGSTYTSTGGSGTHTHSLSDAGQAQVYHHDAGGNTFVDSRQVSTATFTSTNRTLSAGNTSGVSSNTGAALRGSTDSASSNPPYQAAYIFKRTA